ncbi:MAG: tRNA sulfurtransferase [Candidatus Bathyarchaeia archaeon]
MITVRVSFNIGKKDIEFDSQSKVICLVSGGIDSPVAAWLVMRKGCVPVFVFFDNHPFADETTKQRAMEAIKKLSDYAQEKKLKVYVVPHGDDLTDILRSCPRSLTCVLCRRMMYRLAEKIALLEDTDAIVTGEIIGEHASQTLVNLRVENQAISYVTILRPLLGMNKQEVENLARKIGTFDASTKPASCCTGPPPKPRTRARLEEIREAEERLSIEEMISRDLEGANILEV